jgi:quaternary ammonium compound-resistance protein SugE
VSQYFTRRQERAVRDEFDPVGATLVLLRSNGLWFAGMFTSVLPTGELYPTARFSARDGGRVRARQHVRGSQTMPWLYLFLAGLLEIVFAVSLRNSAGFTRPLWILPFLLSAGGSLFLLSQALRFLPLGVSYAIWTGIGAAGTAIVGMWFFGESREFLKILSLIVVLVGLAGLQLTSASQH